MKPQKIKFKVSKIWWLTKRVIELKLKMVEPKEITFIPGQHIGLVVGEGVSRPYCIYTSARKHDEIGIIVSVGHDGIGANFLKKLKLGDIIDGMGPVGRKQIALIHKENIIFATSGTGISPALSILTELKDQGVKSKIKLYFGLRSRKDLFFKDKLDELQSSLSNFSYEIVYSKPEDNWEGLTGHVTEHINIPDNSNTQVYTIGWGGMIDDIKEKLLASGFLEENIIH